MNNLIISGKANLNIPVSKLRTSQNDEVWLCGTDERKGADLYFEIHGIKVEHKNVIKKFGPEIYQNSSGLSPSNTISGMLIYAWQHGYKNITLTGCPMVIKEYPQQRETVVRLVQYLNKNRLNVVWEDMDMAKANKTQEKADELQNKNEAPKAETKVSKTVKVKFLGLICASYGTFNSGQIAEVPEEIEKELEIAKLAERV